MVICFFFYKTPESDFKLLFQIINVLDLVYLQSSRMQTILFNLNSKRIKIW